MRITGPMASNASAVRWIWLGRIRLSKPAPGIADAEMMQPFHQGRHAAVGNGLQFESEQAGCALEIALPQRMAGSEGRRDKSPAPLLAASPASR